MGGRSSWGVIERDFNLKLMNKHSLHHQPQPAILVYFKAGFEVYTEDTKMDA